MARHLQIVRQWCILLRLAEWRRGVTLEHLTSAAGNSKPRVTDRTVRRDLEALHEAGFEIEVNKDGGGTYYRLLRPEVVEALKLARAKTTPAGPGLRRQFEETGPASGAALQERRHEV